MLGWGYGVGIGARCGLKGLEAGGLRYGVKRLCGCKVIYMEEANTIHTFQSLP